MVSTKTESDMDFYFRNPTVAITITDIVMAEELHYISAYVMSIVSSFHNYKQAMIHMRLSTY